MGPSLHETFSGFDAGRSDENESFTGLVHGFRKSAVVQGVERSTKASETFYKATQDFSFSDTPNEKIQVPPIVPFWEGFYSTKQAVGYLKNAGLLTELAEEQLMDIFGNLHQSVKKLQQGVDNLSGEEFKGFFDDFNKRVAPQLIWLNEFLNDVVKSYLKMDWEKEYQIMEENDLWQNLAM